MIVQGLNRKLPQRYVAEPRVHLGSSIELDVATYEEDELESPSVGTATAIWSPPRPTLAVATDLPEMDEYEVRVFDTKSGRRLVAAVEIVSPSNKDRPEHRRAFVAKCAALIQNRVCVAIVDLVTTRTSDLYGDLLELLGQTDSILADEPSRSTPSSAAGRGSATPGNFRPGDIPSGSASRCRPCRSGLPRTWPSRSNWNSATRKRAGSFGFRRFHFSVEPGRAGCAGRIPSERRQGPAGPTWLFASRFKSR